MLKENGKTGRGQSAIEYLLLIGASVAFVTLLAYIIKTKIVS